MALTVHPAERTDVLADALGDLLTTPLEDPFAEEIVVVPAKGVERWLTQRLSHRLGTSSSGGDGVCAGCGSSTRARSSRCCSTATETTRGIRPPGLAAARGHRCQPWQPWCATLAAHLGHGLEGDDGELRRNRRYSVARRLAGLSRRTPPSGRRSSPTGAKGATPTAPVAPSTKTCSGRPSLWRRLLGHVGEPPPDVRHADTLARLRAGGEGLDLPTRLSLFGHTRLPVTEVELLEALGEHREVHVWLPQPSPRLWDDLAGIGGLVPRVDDSSAELVGAPVARVARPRYARAPADAGLSP